MHLPIQLLCLWMITSGASLAHVMHSGAGGDVEQGALVASLPAAMLAQLLVGFSLSSMLVYRRDARLRSCFLRSRHAAAVLAAVRADDKVAPLPSTGALCGAFF
jgi:hypothetical protein